MIKVTGMQAIEMAERNGLTLCKYTDPTTEEAREGLSVAEAREIAKEDPALVYIEVSADLVHTRLTEAEVNGALAPDCRRILSGERQALGLAIESDDDARIAAAAQIGRASCRERV